MFARDPTEPIAVVKKGQWVQTKMFSSTFLVFWDSHGAVSSTICGSLQTSHIVPLCYVSGQEIQSQGSQSNLGVTEWTVDGLG